MKRYTLSAKDSVFSGLCGGLAEYFNIDSTLVRFVMLVAILAYFPLLFIYIIISIVAPVNTEEDDVDDDNMDKDNVK